MVDETDLIEFTRRLASTPSVSGDERAAVGLMAEAMADSGMTVEIDRTGNAIGLMGRGEPDAPRLLIDGHIDTIPLHSADSWRVDPCGGIIEGDRLYGLGICDQKASLAAAVAGLSVMNDHINSGPGLVALVASVGEEEMEGAALASVIDSIDPTVVITTEPNDAHLAIGQRGRSKIEVEVIGRACHAGHAEQGVNAVEALASLVEVIRKLPAPEHPNLGRRDITCIDIASEPYPSVSTVPGRAVARFDARFLPGETESSLHELFRNAAQDAWRGYRAQPYLEIRTVLASFTTYTGVEFAVPEYADAWLTAGPLVTLAQNALAEAGLDPSPMYYSFCTNGSYSAGVRDIPTIGFGVGEEHIAHQANEYVTLSSLRRGAKGIAALAMALTRST